MLKAESFDGGLQTFRMKIDAGLHFNRYNIPIVLRKKIKFVRRIGIRPIAGLKSVRNKFLTYQLLGKSAFR